jgi:membrane-bound lytic murein transglycosylase F
MGVNAVVKRRLLLPLAALLAVLLATCARAPSELERVQSAGVLRVITRNSPVAVYAGAAGPEGPEYELVRGFAAHLGVQLKIIEADRYSELLAAVGDNQADLAAAGLTITDERREVVRFGPSYQQVKQQVVYRRGRPTPRQLTDLKNRRIEVVSQSSYAASLATRQAELPDLAWTENPNADAGELLAAVARGSVDLTVVDSNVFAVYQRYHPELRVGFDLTSGDELAWAFRKDSDDSLVAAATSYLAGLRASGELERILDRYYGHKEEFDYAGTRRFMVDYRTRLAPYRAHFIQAEARSDIDWRLLAAIAYQESHWTPDAVSPKGAMGLMMLTADTAELIGVDNPMDATQSISGGAKYLWRLRKRIANLSPEIPEKDLLWMTLAAYNMGYGHLLDARRLTEMREGNPDSWVDVRDTLPLLMERRWYRQLRWGYAHSVETLQYVRNIRNYYDILVWLTEDASAPGSIESGPLPAETVTASRETPRSVRKPGRRSG